MERYILITGGLGFIGANLILRLLEESPANQIVVVDNLQCQQNLDSLASRGILHHSRVKIYEHDICDPYLFTTLLDEYSPYEKPFSAIYHLASIASPIWYKKFPIQTLDVSYTGTKHIFDFALNYPGVHVLIASSSEVYGDALVSPQPEGYFGNTNSYGERSCYDEGKRVMEALAHSYQRVYDGRDGMPRAHIHIARIFNTYGPFMSIEDGRVIPSFIKSFLYGEPIRIFNGGNQTRCFNYIDDTLGGLMALMKSDLYEPVNIGNDREITMWELLEIMKKVVAEKFPEYCREGGYDIVNGTSDRDDPKVRRPELTLARERLGYQIKTGLEKGLEETIQYFHSMQTQKR